MLRSLGILMFALVTSGTAAANDEPGCKMVQAPKEILFLLYERVGDRREPVLVEGAKISLDETPGWRFKVNFHERPLLQKECAEKIKTLEKRDRNIVEKFFANKN